MSSNKQKAQLFSAIWKMANDLRGPIDGWEFKQYVLDMLFYRYMSEKMTKFINGNEQKAGDTTFNYAKISDIAAMEIKETVVNSNGYFLLPSELFENVVLNARNDIDLNVTLKNVFDNIEASSKGTNSEEVFKDLLSDINFNAKGLGNTVEEKNKKLVKILEAIDGIKLDGIDNNVIDLFGDAYEYLMSMYASNAGKSGGEFFTPQEVSELLTKITLIDFMDDEKKLKKQIRKVYDPACGSGSLLLKFAKILGHKNIKEGFYGQEINVTTYNLSRINMFLHDISFDKFSIKLGDTLLEPKHLNEKPFDAIVSNPPYSTHWEGDSNPLLINDERFSPAGILAPKSKADLAFSMHILNHLSADGTAAIVEFPGALYRGGSEQKIRQYLIENNFIEAVIQLPKDLFFGTNIETCIIVIRKNKINDKIKFIDASKLYIKVDSKNKLSDKNIDEIIKILQSDEEIPSKSAIISNEIVVNNSSNLGVNNYIDRVENDSKIDIDEVNGELEIVVKKSNELRNKISQTLKDIKDEK